MHSFKSGNGMDSADISPLVEIMNRLRDPENGCPWDIEQSFATIAPYTIEEAYEVADAIERNDMDALCDELGDLLLQVVFHARMASEARSFGLADVIQGICDKMIRRHPHIFDSVKADHASTVLANWEAIKASERASNSESDDSALSGVAKALPALMRAEKLQKRAARTGFDWPDPSGAIDKLYEEIGEVKEAEDADHRHEEVGDMLFAAVNIARHYGVDAEQALRDANGKFERRFRAMESAAGASFAQLTLEQKEQLWSEAKVSTATRQK